MKSICLVFQVHQPVILKRYHFFDIGTNHDYYDDHAMETSTKKLAGQCYLPGNDLLLKHIRKLDGRFKIAIFVSGVTLEQFALYAPEVLESFKKLADTGCVEFLSGTWSHSLAALTNGEAFTDQVRQHQQIIFDHFRQRSGVFMNPGLIYSDEIGAKVAELGYKGIFTEGAERILGKRSPGFIYSNTVNRRLSVIMSFPRLRDDLTKQFSDLSSNDRLDASETKIPSQLNIETIGEVVPLLLEYPMSEKKLPSKSEGWKLLDQLIFLASHSNSFSFNTPGEIISIYQPVAMIAVPHPVSCLGETHDASYWTGNEIQNEALNQLYDLLPLIRNCRDSGILKDWNYLQTHEHFLYMSDIQENNSFIQSKNPFNSPWEAFISFMNILNDLRLRLEKQTTEETVGNEVIFLKKLLEEKDRQLSIYQQEIDSLLKR